jgi:hypothetical protein
MISHTSLSLLCFGLWILTRLSTLAQTPPLEFERDVAQIFQINCASCHHPSGRAPFSLIGYEEVILHVDDIREVIDASGRRKN